MKYTWNNIKEHPLIVIATVFIFACGIGIGIGKYFNYIEISKLKTENGELKKENEQLKIELQIKDKTYKKANENILEMKSALEPTWIYEELPTQIFSGQLLITAYNINARNKIATFKIIFPDHKEIYWENIDLFTRKSYVFKNKTYIFDILDMKYNEEIGKRGAKVSIVEKR